MVISEGRMLAGIPVGLITIRAEKLTLGMWSNACPLWGAGVPKVPNISPFALKLLSFADGPLQLLRAATWIRHGRRKDSQCKLLGFRVCLHPTSQQHETSPNPEANSE